MQPSVTTDTMEGSLVSSSFVDVFVESVVADVGLSVDIPPWEVLSRVVEDFGVGLEPVDIFAFLVPEGYRIRPSEVVGLVVLWRHEVVVASLML